MCTLTDVIHAVRAFGRPQVGRSSVVALKNAQRVMIQKFNYPLAGQCVIKCKYHIYLRFHAGLLLSQVIDTCGTAQHGLKATQAKAWGLTTKPQRK